MKRMNSANLTELPGDIRIPAYDRSQPAGIVHLGVGAFHRAHQAVYFDALMSLGEAGWMIRGASLRGVGVSDQLTPQDGLYSVVIRDGKVEHVQVIAAIRDVMIAPQDPRALIAALAAPETQLVTMTVTEKGYHLNPATGALDLSAAAIQSDLGDMSMPQTMPGFLVAGLAARRAADLGPFTILSCDNLPHNGVRTRNAVVGMARQADAELAAWIEEHAAFPSSMVDRIVPATTADDIASLEARIGLRDEGMVKTEPFSQWVVEDWFCGRRPALDRVGVSLTNDVVAWEKTKLRLLNGAHSSLAYLGGLAGYTFVHEAVDAPGVLDFINRLWDEAAETLGPAEGLDVLAYRQSLLERFRNPALNHRLRQIAMDGSQKLPQRLLNTIRDRVRRGDDSPALVLGVAGWIHWLSGTDDIGGMHAIDDPLASRFADRLARRGSPAEAIVQAILGLEEMFGTDLRANPVFVDALVAALTDLMNHGAAATIRKFRNA